MRHALAAALLAVALLLAGCREGGEALAFWIAGGTPSPYPTYTRLPTHTPAATYTPAPTHTAYPTYTALPTAVPTRTATRIPTATSVPTPAVTVPANWVEYVDVLDNFRMHRPADWPVDSSEPYYVSLDLPSYGYCDVYFDPETLLSAAIGEADSINQLVELSYMSLPEFSEKLVEKGSWSDPYPMNYVRMEITALADNSRAERLTVQRALGDGAFAVVQLFRAGGKIKQTEIERAQIILGSFELTGTGWQPTRRDDGTARSRAPGVSVS